MEEESIIVDKNFEATKLSGIKKLRLETAESVAGLNEKQIWLQRDSNSQPLIS